MTVRCRHRCRLHLLAVSRDLLQRPQPSVRERHRELREQVQQAGVPAIFAMVGIDLTKIVNAETNERMNE